MTRDTLHQSSAYEPMDDVGVQERSAIERVRGSIFLGVGRAFARHRKLDYRGERLDFVVEPYNLTCVSERGLELAIIERHLPAQGKVLELGNVWGHYRQHEFRVIDKYEITSGVENIDIVDIDASQKFDFVFSISTFEHIGWDENPREPQKLAEAFAKVPQLLDPGGRAVITVPIGWNQWLDEQLASTDFGATSVEWFERTGVFCSWKGSTAERALLCEYGGFHKAANAVAVLHFNG